jgi:hypothetical protein
MDHEWKPSAGSVPKIVCAACRRGEFIAAGPRHFDAIMRAQIEAAGLDELAGEFEQGFIDQFGRFYDRTAALAVVQFSGQPFNADRNGGSGKLLFSEGLY